jgi:hypothetical protein
LVLFLAAGTVYASFTINGTVPVTVTTTTTTTTTPATAAAWQSVQVVEGGTQTCVVSNSGTTFTCPSLNLAVGQSATLSAVAHNPNVGAASVNVNVITQSGNSAVLSIASNPLNPTSIPGSSTSTFTFVIAANGAGIDTASFSISG